MYGFIRFGIFLFCWVSPSLGWTQIYRIDFGSLPTSGYQTIQAGPVTTTPPWLFGPESNSVHLKYKAWRLPAWTDGVVGRNLEWELSVPNGHYELQLFLNTGFEMTSTWNIAVNGSERPLGMQPIRNSPEQPENMEPQVKIWRSEVKVANATLRIRLEGGQDSIRLLAMHLIDLEQEPSNLTARQEWLWEMLQAYGRMLHDPKPLDPMLDHLRSALDDAPNDAWAFKYYQEIQWLQLAERMKDLRGWQWSTNLFKLSMIRKFQQAVMLLDPLVQQPDHPLYERALWLHGRLLFHLDLEYGHEPERLAAQRDFTILKERYPGDTLIRMYTGELFQNNLPDIAVLPHAPEWSKLQAVALERLRRLVHYWVLERQAPNGEMGGKFGDDVEALRAWPALLYIGDSLTLRGLKRLADGVWNSDQIANGFARDVSDVEHAAEFISDTAPLLIAASDEPSLHERALPTAHLMDTLWTTEDPDGDLFFRSSWYSSREVDERPPRNRDVPMNTRTTKVLRYYLWRCPENTFVRDLLYRWSKSWAKLAAGTAKGKPAGILPVSYRVADGAINGDEPNWYQANMYWSYYDFQGDVMMLDQMLFLRKHIEDDLLLQPVEAVLKLVGAYSGKEGPEGSAAWAANQYSRRKDFQALAGQWRLLTRRSDYDTLLLEKGSSYLKYRISGNMEPILADLKALNEDIGYNWPMMTSDCWFTDRIYVANTAERRRVSGDILKTMLTGDMNSNGTSPYMAVTWEQVRPGFTALVKNHSSTSIEIDLFNHGMATEVVMRLWNLKPGQYALNLNGVPVRNLTVKQAGQRVELKVPSGKVLMVDLTLN